MGRTVSEMSEAQVTAKRERDKRYRDKIKGERMTEPKAKGRPAGSPNKPRDLEDIKAELKAGHGIDLDALDTGNQETGDFQIKAETDTENDGYQCYNCGYQSKTIFSYCPKCGTGNRFE